MKGTEELRQALADYLTKAGLPAVCAWPEGERAPMGKTTAAVSLRELQGTVCGFQDYLGEQYDRELDRWVELYGKRVKLCFGVEVYGATAHQVGLGLDRAAEALGSGRPGGMRLLRFSAGETGYRKEARRYGCSAEAEFAVWAYGRTGEDGTFLDFTVKGEISK